MVENEKLAKTLETSRQEAKQLLATMQNVVSTFEEMRTMILSEVSTLGDTLWKLYDGFFTVHKEVFHLHCLHQWSKEFVQTLKNIHASIAHVQEWTMQ